MYNSTNPYHGVDPKFLSVERPYINRSNQIQENYNRCGCNHMNQNCATVPGLASSSQNIYMPYIILGTKKNGECCKTSPECSSGFCKIYGSPAQNGWNPSFQMGFCETLK